MLTGVTIYVCESQPVVVEGVIRVLEGCTDLTLAGYATDMTRAIEEVSLNAPDVFVVGQPPAARSILPLLAQVRDAGVTARTVLWMNEVSEMDAFRALQMGARGVTTRIEPIASFLACIRIVASGGVCIESASPVPNQMEANRGAALRLTPRERQIVEAVSQGMKNKQIAEALSITAGTVKVHLMHIFEKTGARNRFQLALQGPHLLRYGVPDVSSRTAD
jgi:DNA-binding NarL/FixJ family response regulator